MISDTRGHPQRTVWTGRRTRALLYCQLPGSRTIKDHHPSTAHSIEALVQSCDARALDYLLSAKLEKLLFKFKRMQLCCDWEV